MHQVKVQTIGIILFSIISCVNCLGKSSLTQFMNYGDDTCDELLQTFAQKSANYSFCVIQNSRPIRLCEKCVKSYQMTLAVHKDILTLENEEGEMCRAKLMNLDRLQVIDGEYKYVTNLWKRASCNSCFDVDENDIPTDKLNERTEVILQLSNLTKTCIDQHRNDTYVSLHDPEVCSVCKNFYQDLNSQYESMKMHGFCMDIVDLMNTTRAQWSSDLGCNSEHEKTEWLFILMTIVVANVPFAFYLAAYLLVALPEHTVFRQRRLNDRFGSLATVNNTPSPVQ